MENRLGVTIQLTPPALNSELAALTQTLTPHNLSCPSEFGSLRRVNPRGNPVSLRSSSSLRGEVYDLNANLSGTLEIPLSAIVTPASTTSFK